MYPDHRACAPPDSTERLASTVAGSRHELSREARWVMGAGLVPYVGILVMVGIPTLINWLTGSRSVGPQPGLMFDPADAAATLAVFASVVVALAVTSRTATGTPDSYTIARERVWNDVGRLCGAASVFVSAGVLLGGLAHPADLLISFALAGVGVALSLLSVSATPSNSRDVAVWARRLRAVELAQELSRYERVATQWGAQSQLTVPGWYVAEALRWWALTTFLIASTSAVLGNPANMWLWASGSAVVAAAVIGLWIFLARYAGSAFIALIDREPISALMSMLLLCGLVLLFSLLAVLVTFRGPTNGASVAAFALVGALCFVIGPITTVVGARSGWPRWRWYRPGLALRASVRRHCARRREALLRQRDALVDVPTGVNPPRSRWKGLRRRYDRLSGAVGG